MKTADLIPLILFELDECDKYGFELTKNIDTKSNGKIVIKQPTLYTLLKKLEKSKFISSYWEDSEIGGKRHYYKITNNGKMQLSTLPSYQELIRSICAEDGIEDGFDVVDDISTFSQTETNEHTKFNAPTNVDIDKKQLIEEPKHISIMDALLESSTPLETVLPSDEVFDDENIDTSTELEVNVSNADMLKEDVVQQAEQFAVNQDVTKFTEKIETVTDEYKSQFNDVDFGKTLNIHDYPTLIKDEPIKFVEYVDFKKSENYKYAKSTAKRSILKCFATSLFLIAMLTICAFVCAKVGTSPFYYISIILGSTIAIFYSIISLSRYEKMRLELQSKPYEFNLKKRIYVALGVVLVTLITAIIVNISIDINTMMAIMSINNFANFYTPLLLSTASFADIVFSIIIIKKK